MRFKDLENSRIAILGFGREGQAVWRQLRQRFPAKKISIYTESVLDKGLVATLTPRLDKHICGPLDAAKLMHFDVLVRSAGISPYRPELQQCHSLGVRFTTASNLWFAENPTAQTICISGTMGKSTTAALMFHLLNAAGIKACLAGNIGRPMLDCEDDDVDWWVIELSSYQLSDLEAKPDIALLLNLTDEHVDWHGSVERYREDKLNLAALAREGRLLANHADPMLRAALSGYKNVTWFNHESTWLAGAEGVSNRSGTCVSSAGTLPGAHNLQNLAAVLTTLDMLSVEVPSLESALSSFSGLPHRLQLAGVKAGIRYVDDSISTTPVSVAAALQTIGHEDVVLLLGGMDRGLDWSGFSAGLSGRVPWAIITLPDNGAKIFNCLQEAGIQPQGGLHQVTSLAEAVALARELVPENGCVLLSPGAPSFPHFRDFEDRGNQFKTLSGIEKCN